MKKGLVVAVVLASLAGCDAPTYFRTEVPEAQAAFVKEEDAIGVAIVILKRNGYTITNCSFGNLESQGEGFIEATRPELQNRYVRTRIDASKDKGTFVYHVKSFYVGHGQFRFFQERVLKEEGLIVKMLDEACNPKPIKQPERPIPYQTPYPTPPTTRPAPEPVRPIPIPPIPIEKVWALRR